MSKEAGVGGGSEEGGRARATRPAGSGPVDQRRVIGGLEGREAYAPSPSGLHSSAIWREGCRIQGTVKLSQAVGVMVKLVVKTPGWKGAGPGQFALLQAEPSRCFLARAVSVSDQSGSEVSFVIAPIGTGTGELCGLEPGEMVWVLGPLGKGFDLDALVAGGGRIVIVAGGVGVAPFPLLLRQISERHRAAPCGVGAKKAGGARAGGTGPAALPTFPEVLALLGFQDRVQAEAADLVREAALALEQQGLCCQVEVATGDASCGLGGTVVELLERHVRPGDRVAVCGPWAMCKAVWRVCSVVADVRAWFSLEANVACGVGSCHGCVVRLADGSWARVCREGPVFAGTEVFGG